MIQKKNRAFILTLHAGNPNLTLLGVSYRTRKTHPCLSTVWLQIWPVYKRSCRLRDSEDGWDCAKAQFDLFWFVALATIDFHMQRPGLVLWGPWQLRVASMIYTFSKPLRVDFIVCGRKDVHFTEKNIFSCHLEMFKSVYFSFNVDVDYYSASFVHV